MCSKGFLRRVVPFFVTFLVGVFIASFFVTIERPSFGGRRHHMEMDRQIRMELDRVTEENFRLREQLGEHPAQVERELVQPGIRGLVPPPPPPVAAHPAVQGLR